GYGLLASEVDDVANAFQCSGDYYCLEKDENAPRNYIYDLVDLAEDRYTRIGKKTDVVFVLSVVLHWVYNEDEIENLATLNSLEDLDAAVLAGTISEDFRTRIMENYDAYSLLYNSDYINVVGAEFGNELYFHQELTTLDKTLNGNPFFNLQTTLNQVYHRFEMLVTMIDFYRRILTPVDPELKIGLPAGNINHVGGMTNLNLVYNTAIKELALDHIDALVHHLYIKNDGADVNPANNTEDNDPQLVDIKEGLEDYAEVKYTKIMNEFEEFFDLKNNDLKIWLTEWNGNKASAGLTIWDEWGNTLLHGIYLNRMMEKIGMASAASTYVTLSNFHTWTSLKDGFLHNMITMLDDQTIVKRASYWSNYVADFLKSTHVRKLSANLTTTQAGSEFYKEAFYSYNQEESDACPIEKLNITFSNLRSDQVTTTFDFTNNIITLDNIQYHVLNGKLKAYKGENLASACGQSYYNASEEEDNYNIEPLEMPLVLGQPFTIPAYTSGVFEFSIEPVINTCIPLSSHTSIQSDAIVLNLSPNPVGNLLTIELGNNLNQLKNTDLLLVNAMGQLVNTIKVQEQVIHVDVSNYAKGMYFVSTGTENDNRVVGSFVKD
ncbi:MAG: T9SS type A sorting domain-containing protein, partial [Bacteroidetes bacterium]|nr:T9SS type A sorting domain-containing protein [Bacteroidota bacterium]